MRISVVGILIFALWPAHLAGAEDPVHFADPVLKAAVEDALWVLDPTPTDMQALSKLVCVNSGVTSVRGLEFAENLQHLNLRFNQISGVSALSGLTNLRHLDLSRNYEISSIGALAGLTRLDYLNLHINQIEDISALSEMRDLTYLDLHGNQIVDISALSQLDELEHLGLNENSIEDITPLAGLTKLNKLYLHYNQIEDISALSALTSVHTLNIYLNDVSDISPLSRLTGLQTLSFHYNQVSDISALADLRQLRQLRMQANPLNREACDIYLPLILDNNPGIHVEYDACGGGGHTLSISSTEGGSVTEPGEGPRTYAQVESVTISATARSGYAFVGWTGSAVSAGKVADPSSAHTAVLVDGNYTLEAGFVSTETGCPAVSTYPAKQVGDTSAVLVACLVENGGEPCAGKFVYWVKGQEAQAKWVTSTQNDLRQADMFSERVHDLLPATTYCYFGLVENSACRDEGSVQEFTTEKNLKVSLTLSARAGGSIVAPQADELLLDPGTPLLIRAEAKPHHQFSGWSGTAVDAGQPADPSANPIVVIVKDSYTLQANFLSLLPVLYVDDDALGDPAPFDPNDSDPLENGTVEHPFDSVQEAIEVASDGARVQVRSGQYREDIDFLGKNIVVAGIDPNDPNKTGLPVLAGAEAGPVVRFVGGETSDCRLHGFVITGGVGTLSGAIHCMASSPTVSNCLIVGNRALDSNGAGIYCVNSRAAFDHCTIADNIGGEHGAGVSLVKSNIVLMNSIVWGNAPQALLLDASSQPSISYTNISGAPGPGNIAMDPLFAQTGNWANPQDPNQLVDPADETAVWLAGDYHLLSQAGRWDPHLQIWLQDDVTSPCIDIGLPTRPVVNEPMPHGGVVNLGAYGNTKEASKTH